MNKRITVGISVVMLGVMAIALIYYGLLPVSNSVKYKTVSEKITLLNFNGRFLAARGEDIGILLEAEGGQEDSITFPFGFNPVNEGYSVKDMYLTIAGHTLVQENTFTLIITLNDQTNQTVNDYIDESAISWFSFQLDTDFHDTLQTGINTITLHGYQAANINLLLYQIFLHIEYQYVA